jgi:hypothetical protein
MRHATAVNRRRRAEAALVAPISTRVAGRLVRLQLGFLRLALALHDRCLRLTWVPASLGHSARRAGAHGQANRSRCLARRDRVYRAAGRVRGDSAQSVTIAVLVARAYVRACPRSSTRARRAAYAVRAARARRRTRAPKLEVWCGFSMMTMIRICCAHKSLLSSTFILLS